MEEWQKGPLDEVYPIAFIGAIHYSVKNDGIVTKRLWCYLIQAFPEAAENYVYDEYDRVFKRQLQEDY